MSESSFLARAVMQMPRQVDQAVALLWLDARRGKPAAKASELATRIHVAGLPKPNPTRLREALQADGRVHRSQGGFRIDVRMIGELTMLSSCLDDDIIESRGELLPNHQTAPCRPWLASIAREANVAFETGLYNSAAVMFRRLIEGLLIDLFDATEKMESIRRDGKVIGLEAVITCLPNRFTVSRNLTRELGLVKRIGDLAAHDRSYLVRRQDLWEVRLELRRSVDELVRLRDANGSSSKSASTDSARNAPVSVHLAPA